METHGCQGLACRQNLRRSFVIKFLGSGSESFKICWNDWFGERDLSPLVGTISEALNLSRCECEILWSLHLWRGISRVQRRGIRNGSGAQKKEL
jgi:hypothetical protein